MGDENDCVPVGDVYIVGRSCVRSGPKVYEIML